MDSEREVTTFTKDAPFEFEGVKVWRDPNGEVHYPRSFVLAETARAIHAFIEAESHPATWTEQGDGTWRKGRWVAVKTRGYWRMTHEDFPGVSVANNVTEPTSGNGPYFDLRHAWWEQVQDFLAHLAAQKSEPEFTPLPVPEVGKWIRAELRDGTVVEGEVTDRRLNRNFAVIDVGDDYYFIPLTANYVTGSRRDIIAWSPIDPPQPEEPTGLGAVVTLTRPNGHGRVIVKVSTKWWANVGNHGGERRKWEEWLDEFPNVTVESPGVEL